MSASAARTRVLLEAPVLPTLVRLAWPNLLVMLAQSARALRTAWLGAALAFALAESEPAGWLNLFTHDPAVLEAGATYLRRVGPVVGFFGLGAGLVVMGVVNLIALARSPAFGTRS